MGTKWRKCCLSPAFSYPKCRWCSLWSAPGDAGDLQSSFLLSWLNLLLRNTGLWNILSWKDHQSSAPDPAQDNLENPTLFMRVVQTLVELLGLWPFPGEFVECPNSLWVKNHFSYPAQTFPYTASWYSIGSHHCMNSWDHFRAELEKPDTKAGLYWTWHLVDIIHTSLGQATHYLRYASGKPIKNQPGLSRTSRKYLN